MDDEKGQTDKKSTTDGWKRVRERTSVTVRGGRYVAVIGTMAGQILLGLALKLLISLHILFLSSLLCQSLLFCQFYFLHFSPPFFKKSFLASYPPPPPFFFSIIIWVSNKQDTFWFPENDVQQWYHLQVKTGKMLMPKKGRMFVFITSECAKAESGYRY